MTTRPDNESPLILPEKSFVVFVDDTGHEALVPGHPVYGLGGCAAMDKDLDRIIRQPWREVRRKVTGSPDTPLHANTFAGFATPEQSGRPIMDRDQDAFVSLMPA
jgi:hypothetical protein